ncbi:MAG: hypothetical protein U0Q16_27440 [Bryobacteraceae bacterium]
MLKARKKVVGISGVRDWWERRVRPFVDPYVVPIREEHVDGLLLLPDIHKDPFDRILIAQA